MPVRKKTKIVATLGPASSTKEVLKGMLDEGVNVFRINFSHADYSDVEERIKIIRELNDEYGYNASILGDLQGPKLRVGVMKEEVVVNAGDEIIFATGERFEGTKDRVYMTYKTFPQDAKPGERILLDDGKLIFEVVSTNLKDEVVAKVIQGGPLKSKKGVNLPNTNISQPALTKKDIDDAIFAIGQEVDWIALSFVRHAEDLMQLQDLIAKHSAFKIPIIAKIEKPEAVTNIDKIVAQCDGLMVARGDLGVEVPAEEVPLIQKQLVLRAKKARIPVIIATQMMESMILNASPTRAEITDVANGIFDGADALMLSGETAVGKHPVKVIETFGKVIQSIEKQDSIYNRGHKPDPTSDSFISDSICLNACDIADQVNAKAIIGMTKSGYTAFTLSSFRPKAAIFVFTESEELLSTVSLIWGVRALPYSRFVSTDETIRDVHEALKKQGLIEKGDVVVNTGSMPLNQRGKTNMVKVTKIK